MTNNNVESSSRESFHVGAWEAHPRSCRLVRNGTELKLTPRSMDVLVYLAERAGVAVSHDELLDAFWRGSISTPNAIQKCVVELRHALGNGDGEPNYIETVPKRGYRLIAAVRPLASPIVEHRERNGVAKVDESSSDRNPIQSSTPPRFFNRHRWLLGAAALVGIVVVGTSLLFREDSRVDGPQTAADVTSKSIAVLPFRNLNSDSEHDELAAGIPDLLRTSLSHVPGLTVADRARSLGHSIPAQSVHQIGAELNVGYVLDGSVQGLGDQVRVAVSLYDAADGHLIYAYTQDESVDRPGMLKDKAIADLTSELEIEFDDERSTEMREWGTRNVKAYLAAREGEYFLDHGDRVALPFAASRFRDAIALDPGFLRAYKCLTDTLGELANKTGTEEFKKTALAEIKSLRETVTRIDPTYEGLKSIQFNETRLGTGNFWARLEAQARAQIEAAGPPAKEDYSYVLYADYLMTAHLFREAEQFLQVYERFKSDNPWVELRRALLAGMTVGPIRGIPAYEKLQRLFPNDPALMVGLTAQYMLANQYETADRYVSRLREIDPTGEYAHASWLYLAVHRGDLRLGSGELRRAAAEPGLDEFAGGLAYLMIEDVETGLGLWRKIRPARKETAYRNTVYAEEYVPASVVEDPRYQAYLDDLGIGQKWTEFMRAKVAELAPVTGVMPSDQGAQAVFHTR